MVVAYGINPPLFLYLIAPHLTRIKSLAFRITNANRMRPFVEIHLCNGNCSLSSVLACLRQDEAFHSD